MNNFEYYKDELEKLANANRNIAVNKKGKLCDCDEIDCSECLLDSSEYDCSSKRIMWLLSEHKEYPKLTKFQYILFKKLNKEFNWIVRCTNAVILFPGKSEPIKKGAEFYHYWSNGESTGILMKVLDDLDFLVINELWNIQELLENCEVEE